jgi:hypothetical protein
MKIMGAAFQAAPITFSGEPAKKDVHPVFNKHPIK